MTKRKSKVFFKKNMNPKFNILGNPYYTDWERRLFPFGIQFYFSIHRRRIERLYEKFCKVETSSI
jgi:hypothetical protein